MSAIFVIIDRLTKYVQFLAFESCCSLLLFIGKQKLWTNP